MVRARAVAFLLGLLLSGGALAESVLFLATGNVPPGKFRLLAEVAKPHGIAVELRHVDKIPVDADASLFAGFDAVFFDTYLVDYVRGKLARALPGLRQSHLWLYEAQPAWGGMPEPVARRLLAYYANGGRANFDGFFRTLRAQIDGRPLTGIPEPVVFPRHGLYHPLAPQRVFADLRDYLAWKGIDPARCPPTIGIALHQQYIASEQTAFIDDLIARIERTGALALPFYGPVMDADAVRRTTLLDGKPAVDAIINTQIMLNPDGRRQEFDALGVPVIQAMPYRKGDQAEWEADPHGIAVMDVPFYLAQSEYAGVADIQIAAATRKSDEQIVAIDAQAEAVVNKALKLVRLQRTANAEKRVAIMFWNYPPGEKNLSASFMNLPRSLEASLRALHAAGYRTESPGETELTLSLQRLLAPYYDPPGDQRELESLVRDGLAELLPVATYRAWLGRLPAHVVDALRARWGEPEQSSMVLWRDGAAHFAVPRLKLGNLALLPQPPRGERREAAEKALYHDMNARPSHFYLAAYLWIREGQRADALVHFGTHGTQEWQPGKERGLSVFDYPMLAVGDVPVIYPYIVDDVGEAIQAKRRGRAVTISYQTPPFAPAGLHDSLVRIHDLLHAWLAQEDGAVRDKTRAEFLAQVRKARIERDIGWSDARIAQDFRAFLDAVHDHLHELARTAQPMGLHTFGRGADEPWRLANVLMMVGKPFWEAMAGPDEEADEMLVGDYTRLTASTPYRRLREFVLDGADAGSLAPPLREMVAKARDWHVALGADGELRGFLAALDGRYIPTSYGGDPMKNPDSLPTGRNLYGFDPSRVPTRAAWEAGKEALENLLASHRAQRGAPPKKLTFALWSVETMRHFGLLEAQALWALGVEPVWDAGGRVTDVRLVPRDALGRARVDVVLSATGLYRDHFPNTMKLLAKAAQLAAQADDGKFADNPVAANTLRIARRLEARGLSAEAALRAAQTRLFASESGRYGTGLDDATLATDQWKGKAEGDRKLAALYLSRMQYAYGPDEAEWGRPGQGVNLYAEHLSGTEGAVLSRTSNLYGMLTTDDPFQYLGGIALAVRHLDGKAPELYIANLRGTGAGKVEGAAQFLAKELATRNFHPGYIKGLMAEGYAGTLQVLDGINNFWGWQATAREIVRDDQWQEFVDVYVRDKHRLGVRQWFESKNPHALAQSIERMLEAARQGYWQADADTLRELRTRYRELAQRHRVRSDNAVFTASVAAGFGDAAPVAAAQSAAPGSVADPLPAPAPAAPPEPQVRGMRLERVEAPAPPSPIHGCVALALLFLAAAAGAMRPLLRVPHRQPAAPRVAIDSTLLPEVAHATAA